MKVRIGTRKSRLALAQAQLVADKLKEVLPQVETELVYISTKGDREKNIPLDSMGGKGVFVSDIETALVNKEIDLAVHSAKDLPVELAKGLSVSAVLKRGSCRDVLVVRTGNKIQSDTDMTVGTGSLRRRLYVEKLFRNAHTADIRGNVDTRLNKLLNGEYDALILAMAGLERLGLTEDERFDFHIFNYSDFLPAPCQGIIAVESREHDFTEELLANINDEKTYCAFETERSILNLVGGDCNTPVGAYSYVSCGKINILLSKDCNKVVTGTASVDERFTLAERLVNMCG